MDLEMAIVVFPLEIRRPMVCVAPVPVTLPVAASAVAWASVPCAMDITIEMAISPFLVLKIPPRVLTDAVPPFVASADPVPVAQSVSLSTVKDALAEALSEPEPKALLEAHPNSLPFPPFAKVCVSTSALALLPSPSAEADAVAMIVLPPAVT